MKSSRSWSLLSRAAVTLVAGMAMAACSSSAPVYSSGDSPVILATTSVWADVVGEVACVDDIEIATIVPVGVDPHVFDPSLAQRVAMEQAVLIVENGLSLEVGLKPAMTSLSVSTPVFTASEHMLTLQSTDEGHFDNSTDVHEADPHVWLDPIKVSGVLGELAAVVEDASGLTAGELDECVIDYRMRLESLDEQISKRLTLIAPGDRQIVTDHESLGYFIARYGLEPAGSVVHSTNSLASPSVQGLESLAAKMRDQQIGVIFVDEGQRNPDAAAVARSVGDVALVPLQVAWIDAESPSYIQMMQEMSSRVAGGLSR